MINLPNSNSGPKCPHIKQRENDSSNISQQPVMENNWSFSVHDHTIKDQHISTIKLLKRIIKMTNNELLHP